MPDDNYAQATYHLGRAKALWAQVPEHLPERITNGEQYVQTLRAQSIDWHFKAADVFSRLAQIDEDKRELVVVREADEPFGACFHSMVKPDCASCLHGHWIRTTSVEALQP